jgi:AAHS family 4-hydroxybenzoate transporter-like MFS transporter
MATAISVDVGEFLRERPVGGFFIRVFILCTAVQMLEGYDLTSMAFAAPGLVHDWHINRAGLGAVFSAGNLATVVGAIVFGALGDRFGRRPALIACAFILGIFSLATVYATSISALVILRFCTGLGIGGGFPNAIALVAEYVPARRRGLVLTLASCGISFGAVIGGTVVRSLIASHGWQAVFYIGGFVGIALAVILIVALPESVRFLILEGRPRDRIDRILAKVAPQLSLGADTILIFSDEERSFVRLKGLFTGGRAMLTMLLSATLFASFVTLTFLNQWMPTMLTAFGIATGSAVTAAIVFQLGALVAALVHGLLIDRFGYRVVITINYLFAAAFVVLLVSFGPAAGFITIDAFAVGFCSAGGQNILNGFSGAVYPTVMRASGAGFAGAVGRLGGVVGPSVGGLMFAAHWSVPTMYRVAALPLILTAVTGFLLGRVARQGDGAKPALDSA